MKKNLLAIVGVVLAAFTLVGCGGNNTFNPNLNNGGTPIVTISVSPTSKTLGTSTTFQFTASVSGSTNTGVTWSVLQHSGSGSVDSTGLYTSPAGATSDTVRATSVADPTKHADATVTVQAAPITISITPTTQTLSVSSTFQFSATVSGSTNTAVTWSVIAHTGAGSVGTNGLYSAPSGATTDTVRVTSAADPTKHADATVTVQSGNLNGNIQ